MQWIERFWNACARTLRRWTGRSSASSGDDDVARFQVFKDKRNQWRWRLVAANGKIVAQSEAYTRPSDARKGARAVIRAAQVAYIEEK